MSFDVTNQDKLFKRVDKIYIKDELLFKCIGVGDDNLDTKHAITGFNRSKDLGYALLTYFANHALNIKRMPFCEDRIYYRAFIDTPHEKLKHILNELNEYRIDSIIDELKEIYSHTQKMLEPHNTIKLERKIKSQENRYSSDDHSYAETLIILKKSCEILGIRECKIEMDMLNSFGDEGAYDGDVKLQMNIKKEDILYFSNIFKFNTAQKKPVESGEWVIVNRSPTGVMTIPTEAIIFDENQWSYPKLTLQDAQEFMQNYEPVMLRSHFRATKDYGAFGIEKKKSLINKITQLFT